MEDTGGKEHKRKFEWRKPGTQTGGAGGDGTQCKKYTFAGTPGERETRKREKLGWKTLVDCD